MSASQSNEEEAIARGMAVSQSVRFETDVPFALGRFVVKKIGFARVPVVGMVVYCKPRDLRLLISIVRSFVYTELEVAGIPNEAVEFAPWIGKTERGSRETLFVDTNESSPTKGKRKRGQIYEFHFEIRKGYVNKFVWPRFGDPREGKLPEVALGDDEKN